MGERLITEIVENFDWEKVRKVMLLMNWTWWNGSIDGGEGVPSEEKLARRAKALLRYVWKRRVEGAWNTGGLQAEYRNRGGNNETLELRFVLEKGGANEHGW